MTQNPQIKALDNPRPASEAGERVLLAHLSLPGGADLEDLNELQLLAESAGARVCGIVSGRRPRPDPATFLGKGKVQAMQEQVQRESVDVVLFNHELSPAQERNLEQALGCRVLDRTGLILDIFAQRARSHEGKLQVELAQLEHLSTRLVRGWTHLERQKGGIGLRGPGETQLEADRRLIRERIKHLNKRLTKVRNQRRIRRKSRHKIPIPTVSLVGYTNAGKSSLFNQLTGARVHAADQLFATLDPTMRRLELPGNRPVILADTVGFIRHLPHDLVEAFKSTLEEVVQADLLIHVVDVHNPEHREHIQRVNEVLAEIRAEAIPQILVYNKIDLLGRAPRLQRGADGRLQAVWCSARTGEGVEGVLEALAEHYSRRRRYHRLCLPPRAARLRALLYERMDVLQERVDADGSWVMDLSMDESEIRWLQNQSAFDPDFIQAEAESVLAPTGS